MQSFLHKLSVCVCKVCPKQTQDMFEESCQTTSPRWQAGTVLYESLQDFLMSDVPLIADQLQLTRTSSEVSEGSSE